MKKKTKKRINLSKLIITISAIFGVLVAIAAVLSVLKKRADEQKRREAEIEAEITEIIEKKFAQVETEKSVETNNEEA